MRRRGPAAAAVLAGLLLSGGVLAGCGDGGAAAGGDVDAALDATLAGFHAVAERPTPATLCDPDPADPSTTPPGLPEGLGQPEGAAYQESAPTTVEAYAWTADDADRARDLVAEATTAAPACTWTAAAGGEAQQVAEWSAGDWAGLRITRTVPGQEQVDRRLVARGTVVLLVVTRSDGDDPALLQVADDYLAAVAERLG